MNTLVLGGSGFIGSHLVDRLLADGHRVTVYDRGRSWLRPRPERASFVAGELGNDALVREVVSGADWVFHLASTTTPKTSNDDPLYDVRSNLLDTIQLLDACVGAGVSKIVFPSSGGTVYGIPRSVPTPEDHPTSPITSYGVVKLAIEKYLGVYNHLHGLDYAVVRISNAYGPYQNPASEQGVIPVFMNQLRRGRPLRIWGDGRVVRDYVFVSDIVDAIARAVATAGEPRTFNIGSGRGIALIDLVTMMSEVAGVEPTIEQLPARRLDVPISVLDISRARETLGWAPKVELRDGLTRVWRWILSLPADETQVSRAGSSAGSA